MTPEQFATFCVGGIVALTPLTVYLLWVSSVNRKSRPTLVSASWEFASLLVALSGMLFCFGMVTSSLLIEWLRYSETTVARWIARTPTAITWGVPMAVIFLLVARSARRGFASRRDSFSIFNVDGDVLMQTIDELLAVNQPDAVRAGNSWRIGLLPVVELTPFPVFRHATVKQLFPDKAARETLENQLRVAVPKLPAAEENPAAPWVTAVATCCTVAVGCCVALVFALPLLR